MEKGKILQY